MDYLRVHQYRYTSSDFKEKSSKKIAYDSRNNKGGRGGKGKEKKELWEAKKRQKIEDSSILSGQQRNTETDCILYRRAHLKLSMDNNNTKVE